MANKKSGKKMVGVETPMEEEIETVGENHRGERRKAPEFLKRSNIWRGFFIFHDAYKQYYMLLIFVFTILLTPARVLLTPEFYHIFQDPVMRQEAYAILVVFLILGAIFAGIIYLTAWRTIFPTYYIVNKNACYKSGRLYWHSESRFANWVKRKRDLAGVPKDLGDKQRLLVNQGMFLNIFKPSSSMTALHLPKDTPFWRDATSIRVREPSQRRHRISPEGYVEYVCYDDHTTSTVTENRWVAQHLEDDMQHLIKVVQTAVLADVPIAKRKTEASTSFIPDSVIDGVEAEEERRRQEEGGA